MGGILVEADILTVMIILIDGIEYGMSVKETARAEVIPTAETKEVAEMPRLISAELLMPASQRYMRSTPFSPLQITEYLYLQGLIAMLVLYVIKFSYNLSTRRYDEVNLVLLYVRVFGQP